MSAILKQTLMLLRLVGPQNYDSLPCKFSSADVEDSPASKLNKEVVNSVNCELLQGPLTISFGCRLIWVA